MRWTSIIFLCLLSATSAQAQTSQPSSASAALELRATQAFTRGEYLVALPMLRRVEQQLQKQPDRADRLATVQEQIRVCQKNLPPQVASAAALPVGVTSVGDTTAIAAGPPAVRMGTDRVPHPAPKAGETLEMAIKELGNFEYDPEKGGNIPKDVVALTGSKIRLRGFMIPMDQAENISQFALVPSLFACCFGQPPQIQHTILVNCPRGKAVSYYPDEIIVEGTLHVEEKKDEGFVVSLFQIDTTSVKPAPK